MSQCCLFGSEEKRRSWGHSPVILIRIPVILLTRHFPALLYHVRAAKHQHQGTNSVAGSVLILI
jgi:hypothetical protein